MLRWSQLYNTEKTDSPAHGTKNMRSEILHWALLLSLWLEKTVWLFTCKLAPEIWDLLTNSKLNIRSTMNIFAFIWYYWIFFMLSFNHFQWKQEALCFLKELLWYFCAGEANSVLPLQTNTNTHSLTPGRNLYCTKQHCFPSRAAQIHEKQRFPRTLSCNYNSK